MTEPTPDARSKPSPATFDLSATRSQAQESIDTSRTGSSGGRQTETTVPQNFGRYKIEQELGKGAMGVVYLAEDTTIGRKVALKIPKQAVLEEPDALERFYREAKTTGTLRHPNICPVFDVGCIDGVHYLTMAYIPGKPVSSFLGKGKLPAAKQVALLIRKIAIALEEAHKQGVVHRDLKPSNVMLDDRNEPIVMDFGLAFQTNTTEKARLTQSGAILGTPAYMAPEQVRGELDQIGPQSDIYALGVMLYQLLTGELPFSGPIMLVFAQIITEQPRRPAELRPDVDPTLEAICLKMMAKAIDQRYGSMKDVAAALTEYIKTGSVSGLDAGFEDTQTSNATVMNAEPDWDNLPELPGEAEASVRRRSRKKRVPEPRPQGGWSELRDRPWFWPVAGTVVAVPVVLLLAVVAWVSRSDTSTSSLDGAKSLVSDDSDLPPIDYAAERALAEFVLDERGEVSIHTDVSDAEFFREKSRLPRYDFRVSTVTLARRYDSAGRQFTIRTEPLTETAWELLRKCRCSGLELPKATLTPTDVEHLLQLTSLRYINADNTGLDNTQFQKLQRLKRLSGGTFAGCQIDNEGFAAFPATVPTKLGLDATNVDDVGLQKFDLSQLDYFSMHSTKITDEAVTRTLNPNLRALRVAHTKITDALLDRLAAAPSLQWLDIRCNGITPAKVHEYSSSRPQCIIYFYEDGVAKAIQGGVIGNYQPPLLKNPAAVSTQPGSQTSVNATSPVTAPAPLIAAQKVDYAAERTLAEWVLKEGGMLSIIPVGGAPRDVNELDQLPAGNFQVYVANLFYKRQQKAWTVRGTPMPAEGWAFLSQSRVSGLTLPPVPLVPQDVAELAKCTSLTTLYMPSTAITDDDLKSLTALKRLTTLDVSRTKLTNAGMIYLNSLPALDTLYLNGLEIDDAGLQSLNIPALWNLSLWGTKVTDDGVRALQSYKLRTINLNATQVTDKSVEMFTHSELDWVELGGTGITDKTLDLLDGCEKLRRLDVRSQTVSAERAREFARRHPGCKVTFLEESLGKIIQGDQLLSETPPLLDLPASIPVITTPSQVTTDPQAERAAAEWAVQNGALIYVAFPNGDGKNVSKLQDLPAGDLKLVTVNFGAGQPATPGTKAISREGWMLLKETSVSSLIVPQAPISQADVADLASCRSLSYLTVSSTGLTNTDLAVLTKLGNLHSLNLGHTQVTGPGLVSLRAFRNLSQLELVGLNLKDADLAHLAPLKLRQLFLGGNAITDKGLMHLQEMPLGSLYLEGNPKVTDAGIEFLPKAELYYVNLQGTRVTNRALDILDQFPKLNKFVVSDTKVTSTRVKRFAEEHPDCTIIYTEKNKQQKTLNPK